MRNAVSFVRVMNSAGMGKVTKLGKVIEQQGNDVIREAVFANGRCGTYKVSNFMGEKKQTVFDGVRSVEFTTRKGKQSSCNVYSEGKKDYIKFFPTIHSWEIKETSRPYFINFLAEGNATVTPLKVKNNVVNGKMQNKVLSSQEIHTSTKLNSDKGYGTIYEYKDILLDTESKIKPIYQRPDEYFLNSNALPRNILNQDLRSSFKTPLKPLWSTTEEFLR